jgi:hypothetical protein
MYHHHRRLYKCIIVYVYAVGLTIFLGITIDLP